MSSTACACLSWWGANRRLTPALSARWRSSTRAALSDHARPRGRAVDHAEQRPDGQPRTVGCPRLDRGPRPGVHADLAPAITLPCLTKIAPRRGSRSVSVTGSASWIRSPPRQSTTIRAVSRWPWRYGRLGASRRRSHQRPVGRRGSAAPCSVGLSRCGTRAWSPATGARLSIQERLNRHGSLLCESWTITSPALQPRALPQPQKRAVRRERCM